MTAVEVLGRVGELTNGTVRSADAATGAGIGPYWESRVMRLLEQARTEDAQLEIPPLPCDRQRPGPRRKRLVQLAEVPVGRRHERTDTPPAAIVMQPLGTIGVPP